VSAGFRHGTGSILGLHLYITDAAAAAWWDKSSWESTFTSEGVAGYIFTRQQPGTVPIYWATNGPWETNLYTTNRSEARSTIPYALTQLLGYVYSPPADHGLPCR
jgi:hypothetical protein